MFFFPQFESWLLFSFILLLMLLKVQQVRTWLIGYQKVSSCWHHSYPQPLKRCKSLAWKWILAVISHLARPILLPLKRLCIKHSDVFLSMFCIKEVIIAVITSVWCERWWLLWIFKVGWNTQEMSFCLKCNHWPQVKQFDCLLLATIAAQPLGSAVSLRPLLKSRLKCLSNYLMDCHGICTDIHGPQRMNLLIISVILWNISSFTQWSGRRCVHPCLTPVTKFTEIATQQLMDCHDIWYTNSFIHWERSVINLQVPWLFMLLHNRTKSWIHTFITNTCKTSDIPVSLSCHLWC